ncbi:MAG TPA: hypothetical protein VGQ39_13050 [Pyrinomonadaceae bacterium]|jgi:hypothetical protein|nr:hypothetical protein [Pyrinomonadaceae bacterium]
MSKQEEADLILKLYDLRRESLMREARNWFFTFNPQGPQDFLDVLTSDKSGHYRMVISYWDMACSLVNNGAIDAQMFNDANGEHIFVYAKMEPWIPVLREQMGLPQFLAHLEKTVKALPDYEERLAAVRDRIQKLIAAWQQRNAQAAAVGN